MTVDSRDLQIAVLRLFLRDAVRYLSFAAGREVADDPDWAQQVMDRVSGIEEVLNLTGPGPETEPRPDGEA
ncbi:hypothetical protein ACZ90_04250 [Streptomyces albus subsp. albus]|nr:hypothetical protein ADK33_25780 [Streptomyces griseus subsp. rhodochrous]KUJ70377.1 hypothetical protein ACZ90_04250 [Streptomyces albus subsp. albus]